MNTRSKEYRHLHFAIMVIEASAKRQKVSAAEMYDRLKAQDLINQRLNRYYETLHTQSLDWVVEDTLETLHNWEQEQKGEIK
jgi:hypothetical protein